MNKTDLWEETETVTKDFFPFRSLWKLRSCRGTFPGDSWQIVSPPFPVCLFCLGRGWEGSPPSLYSVQSWKRTNLKQNSTHRDTGKVSADAWISWVYFSMRGKSNAVQSVHQQNCISANDSPLFYSRARSQSIVHICPFYYTTAIWGLEILHLKVRKFATKVASCKLHSVCILHFMCKITLLKSYIVCKITLYV